MANNDKLQFTPIGEMKPLKRNRELDTREYRRTEVYNHGKKRGTTRWNPKVVVSLLVAGGIALSVAGIKMGDTNTQEPTAYVQVEPINYEDEAVVNQVEARYTVDYLIKSGDTLDGIILSYVKDTNEMNDIKRDVCFYNNIKSPDMLQVGDKIVLFRVPESMVDELNTGYNEEFVEDDLSRDINQDVEALNNQVGTVAGGSLLDTVNKELAVYNSTTIPSVRKHLAENMRIQIGQIQQYELNSESEVKTR